jgi:hypothetical protein
MMQEDPRIGTAVGTESLQSAPRKSDDRDNEPYDQENGQTAGKIQNDEGVARNHE